MLTQRLASLITTASQHNKFEPFDHSITEIDHNACAQTTRIALTNDYKEMNLLSFVFYISLYFNYLINFRMASTGAGSQNMAVCYEK